MIQLFHFQISCSCSVFEVDSKGSIFVYNAGSPGWFVISKGKVRLLPLRSSPLGMTEQASIAKQEVSIDKGDIYFSFIDGYIEGARAIKRLKMALEKEMLSELSNIHEILDAIGEGARLDDDKTLWLLKLSSKASVGRPLLGR